MKAKSKKLGNSVRKTHTRWLILGKHRTWEGRAWTPYHLSIAAAHSRDGGIQALILDAHGSCGLSLPCGALALAHTLPVVHAAHSLHGVLARLLCRCAHCVVCSDSALVNNCVR